MPLKILIKRQILKLFTCYIKRKACRQELHETIAPCPAPWRLIIGYCHECSLVWQKINKFTAAENHEPKKED